MSHRSNKQPVICVFQLHHVTMCLVPDVWAYLEARARRSVASLQHPAFPYTVHDMCCVQYCNIKAEWLVSVRRCILKWQSKVISSIAMYTNWTFTVVVLCKYEIFGVEPFWVPGNGLTWLTSITASGKTGHGSHQHQHAENYRPTPIRIPPQQIHRWCNLNRTPHCPFPPGQKEHLCENAVDWLQLSVQHQISNLKSHH